MGIGHLLEKSLLDFGLDGVPDLVNLVQDLFQAFQRYFTACAPVRFEPLVDSPVHYHDYRRAVVGASQFGVGHHDIAPVDGRTEGVQNPAGQGSDAFVEPTVGFLAASLGA